jgi:hypothetical protein
MLLHDPNTTTAAAAGDPPSNFPQWSNELQSLLANFEWNVCLCPISNPCDCGRPIIPEGALQGRGIRPSVIAGVHCLSFSRVREFPPGFEVGLRQGLLANGHHTEPGPPSQWRFLASAAVKTFSIPNADIDQIARNEHFLRRKLPSQASRPQVIAHGTSGCLCANVLVACGNTWKLLASHFDSAAPRSSEDDETVLAGMLDAVSTLLIKLDNSKQLLSTFTSDDYPFTHAILEDGLYWFVQHTLFLLHSYTMIKTHGWHRAKEIYEDGGLPWQIGWVTGTRGSLSLVGKVLCNKLNSNLH